MAGEIEEVVCAEHERVGLVPHTWLRVQFWANVKHLMGWGPPEKGVLVGSRPEPTSGGIGARN